MTKKLICISCPVGCGLSAEVEGGEVVSVEGNACPRGAEYARSEIGDPRRVVTTIVRVEGQKTPLPVRTSAPIQKKYLLGCVREAQKRTLKPPVAIGDVIVKNVCGSGVDIIATMGSEEL